MPENSQAPQEAGDPQEANPVTEEISSLSLQVRFGSQAPFCGMGPLASDISSVIAPDPVTRLLA